VFNDRSNTESIYFFGGNNTAGTRFNDTYQCQLKFSPSVTWSNQSSGGGSVPSSRYGHSTAIYAPTGSRQEMYVFGGNDGAYRNDLSYCNVKDSGSYNWTALNPSGKPSGRVYASSAFDDDNDNMYVFGGYNGAALGDFYVYAIDGNWATASLAGTPPTARYGHTSCYDGAGTIYLLGGRNITDYFNDFYAYDVSASTWTQLSLSSSGGMVSCSFTMRPHPNMNATAGNSNYTFSGQARGHDHGIK
jgi:N-acetylneuraminic acid mutarotase